MLVLCLLLVLQGSADSTLYNISTPAVANHTNASVQTLNETLPKPTIKIRFSSFLHNCEHPFRFQTEIKYVAGSVIIFLILILSYALFMRKWRCGSGKIKNTVGGNVEEGWIVKYQGYAKMYECATVLPLIWVALVCSLIVMCLFGYIVPWVECDGWFYGVSD